jgi:hypothetical protein
MPNGKFDVELFDVNQDKFIKLDKVDVMCNKVYINSTSSNECQMFIKTQINSRDINLYKLTYNLETDHEVKQKLLKSGDSLSHSKLSLQFNGSSLKDSTMQFTVMDSSAKTTSSFQFGLKYWPSHCNYTRWQNSGAYDFRPIDNLFAPLPYS